MFSNFKVIKRIEYDKCDQSGFGDQSVLKNQIDQKGSNRLRVSKASKMFKMSKASSVQIAQIV